MVSTLPISGLATRLAAPARLLAARFLGHRQEAPLSDDVGSTVAAPGGSFTSVENRHHVPVLKAFEDERVWADIIAQYAGIAEGGHWSALLEALEEADRNRTTAVGGQRLADLISKGARNACTKAIADQNWGQAENAIDCLEAELSAHQGSYAAAHILAKARLELGQALRSAGPNPKGLDASARGCAEHFARAEAILELFDPLEKMSPLLAATRYELARCVEDGEAFFRDWYEDWSDLDPTNAQPHFAHAANLLSDWFGAIEDFDDEARIAYKRTKKASGAAAYAAFYLAAADELGDLPEGMDLPLLLTGLQDYFRATGCQHRANIVAGAMTELLHTYTIDAIPGSKRRNLVLGALTKHLTENLREFHLSAWQNGPSGFHFALEQVFARELARGEVVFVGANGLTTRLPA